MSPMPILSNTEYLTQISHSVIKCNNEMKRKYNLKKHINITTIRLYPVKFWDCVLQLEFVFFYDEDDDNGDDDDNDDDPGDASTKY